MPLGILQDRHLEHVPGTATLEDLDPVAALQQEADGKELKKSRNGTILVPQPSNDPNGTQPACSWADKTCEAHATILTWLPRPSQLPPMASRLDHRHPLPQLGDRVHPVSPLGGEHSRTRALLQFT